MSLVTTDGTLTASYVQSVINFLVATPIFSFWVQEHLSALNVHTRVNRAGKRLTIWLFLQATMPTVLRAFAAVPAAKE